MARLEENSWSSGNSREHSGILHKSLTAANRLMNPLFPKVVRKDEEDYETEPGRQPQEEGDIEEEHSDSEEESSESDSSTSSSSEPRRRTFSAKELKEKARSFVRKALRKRGYSESLLDNDRVYSALVKALVEDGEIVSEKTGRIWMERAIPEEAPAFVRPGKLKVGDRVQVLNWVPLGVHGAVVDLFPKGKVSKIYEVKCLVSKDPMPMGKMVRKDTPFEEQRRVLGMEIDGKGPFSTKEKEDTPFPYVTKDSSVIVRFPPMAEPSGETSHTSPSVM